MVDYLRSRGTALGPAEICARFRAAAGEFEATLAGLTEAEARCAPDTGDWSVAQVADHLAQTMIRSADELRHLLAGRRPPAPPVYDALTSAGALWAPWDELLAGVRSANAEFDQVLRAAASTDPAPGGTIRTILVAGTEVFPAELDWKQYALVQRLHLLDHRTQVRKIRTAPAS
jgi:hypothetical protein